MIQKWKHPSPKLSSAVLSRYSHSGRIVFVPVCRLANVEPDINGHVRSIYFTWADSSMTGANEVSQGHFFRPNYTQLASHNKFWWAVKILLETSSKTWKLSTNRQFTIFDLSRRNKKTCTFFDFIIFLKLIFIRKRFENVLDTRIRIYQRHIGR